MSTFDLRTAILASLNPVLESDPQVLLAWADNLDRVADAFAARGAGGLAETKRQRATDLRQMASA